MTKKRSEMAASGTLYEFAAMGKELEIMQKQIANLENLYAQEKSANELAKAEFDSLTEIVDGLRQCVRRDILLTLHSPRKKVMVKKSIRGSFAVVFEDMTSQPTSETVLRFDDAIKLAIEWFNR